MVLLGFARNLRLHRVFLLRQKRPAIDFRFGVRLSLLWFKNPKGAEMGDDTAAVTSPAVNSKKKGSVSGGGSSQSCPSFLLSGH